MFFNIYACSFFYNFKQQFGASGRWSRTILEKLAEMTGRRDLLVCKYWVTC